MIWRILFWLARILTAGIFLYAGYIKLVQPPFLFEMAVDSYQLLPAWAVLLVAHSLPWLELALGVALLSGWKIRYFSAFTALLLGFFLTLMAISFSRGTQATCGCFGGGEPVSAWTLTRDSMMLVVALYLTVYSWKVRRSPASSATADSLPQTEPAA